MCGKTKPNVILGDTSYYYGEGINPVKIPKEGIKIWGQKTYALNSKKGCLARLMALKVKRFLDNFFNRG